MYLIDALPGGGGADGPWCRSCKQPILESHKLVRVQFDHDPHGAREQTGPYHAECSRPFASLARAINLLSRFGH